MTSTRIPTRSRIRTTITSLALALAATVGALAVAPAPAHALEPPIAFWNETAAGLAVSGTYKPVVGDFVGPNPQDDIIWYAPGPATDHFWVSNNDGSFSTQQLPMQVNGANYTPLVGDFAGNALDDVLWYAPGPTQDYLWTANGLGFDTMAKPISGTYQPFVLDDDAGKDDIVWYKPESRGSYIWSFEGGGTHISAAWRLPLHAIPLVGKFNGGVCEDIFWYVPGTGEDFLWFMSCNGQLNSEVEHTVNGHYKPTVNAYSANEDGFDDILWHRHPGGSSLWASDGDGTWTSSAHNIPLAGTPLPAAKNWGFAQIWSPTEQDLIFWDTNAGDYVAPLINTPMGSGYTPIIGSFVGANPDILWYMPGVAGERMYYLPA